MKKSLQKIENEYVQQGLRDKKLEEALKNDKEFQKILRQRNKRLRHTFEIGKKDRGQYVLSTDADLDILSKIYKLEKESLSRQDTKVVKLIRTQLKHDWRSPLVKELNRLLRKYS